MAHSMDRRIVLVGFMACGKTTVGEGLARQLECSFIDLDSQITESQGRSPAQIIKADGEAVFREIETLALRDVLQNRDARVIALGGGTCRLTSLMIFLSYYALFRLISPRGQISHSWRQPDQRPRVD